MGFKYRLRTVDGDDAGTFETNLSDWWPGVEKRAYVCPPVRWAVDVLPTTGRARPAI